jgi:hypothetical protein
VRLCVCVYQTHTRTHHALGICVGGKHGQEQNRRRSIPADTAGCGVWSGQERIGGGGGGNEHKRDGEGAGTISQKSVCRDFVGGG